MTIDWRQEWERLSKARKANLADVLDSTFAFELRDLGLELADNASEDVQ